MDSQIPGDFKAPPAGDSVLSVGARPLPVRTLSLSELLLAGGLPAVAPQTSQAAARLAALAVSATECTNGEAAAGLLRELQEALNATRSEVPEALRTLLSICRARLQRVEGRPHVALNTLHGLAASLAPEWRSWIGWETLMAGGARVTLGEPAVVELPFSRMLNAASAALEAIQRTDRVAFEHSLGALKGACPSWPGLQQEVDAFGALLCPDQQTADLEVLAWRAGMRAQLPFGFNLPTVSAEGAEAEAWVLCVPERSATRLMSAGVGLQAGVCNLSGPNEAGTGGTRTDSAIAVLALAGEKGVAYTDFVRTIYGIAFVPKRHQGMLDVLVHRMRVRLSGRAEIRRTEGSHLVLSVKEPFVIPDGRTSIEMPDRLLRVLGTFGGASAQQASLALGIPRRTAHRLLQQLAAEHSCSALRKGGRVLYRISDAAL